jgi:hypothetical protein
VGEDGREVGGAEVGRDGAEVGNGGALADGVDQVAAVAEQNADGVEQELYVVGKGVVVVILWGIWRGGDRCLWCGVVHVSVCITHILTDSQGKYSTWLWGWRFRGVV